MSVLQGLRRACQINPNGVATIDETAARPGRNFETASRASPARCEPPAFSPAIASRSWR